MHEKESVRELKEKQEDKAKFLSPLQCSPQVPAFPGGLFVSPHYGHSTLLTADGLILTCGGITKPRWAGAR